MTIFRRARGLALSLLVLAMPACDSGGAESWTRELEVESYTARLVYRYTDDECSFVRTYEVTGGDSCDGSLSVDSANAGDAVSGRLVLCGVQMVDTQGDDCEGADEAGLPSKPVFASIDLSAPTADAPMTMRWRLADDLVLESSIDPAAALEETGAPITVRFTDSQTVAGAATREASIDADLELVSLPGWDCSRSSDAADAWRCG